MSWILSLSEPRQRDEDPLPVLREPADDELAIGLLHHSESIVPTTEAIDGDLAVRSERIVRREGSAAPGVSNDLHVRIAAEVRLLPDHHDLAVGLLQDGVRYV